MALTTQTYAEKLGRALAKAVRNEPAVEEVWVSTRPDGVDLWLITQDIDADTERELFDLTDVLYAQFKRPDFLLYVVNPCYFRGDPHGAVPHHAVQIPLAPA